MATGPPMAVAQFRMSYSRGAFLQTTLALVGAVAAAGVWLNGGPVGWLGAGVLLGAVVPYALLGIAPTTSRLRDRALAPDSPDAHRLLRRWGHLHAVRTLAALGAAGLMLRLLARS